MDALKAIMKRHTINIDSFYYEYSSPVHALSASSFSFNVTSTSSYDEWLIDFVAYYHMVEDKDIVFTLKECNTKQIFVGDDGSLSVVGFGIVHLDDGHFNDVLCVLKSLLQPSISILDHSFRWR